MDLSETLLEIIDMRSFSNLWFWIALAVMWSTASLWVLGVPNDMIVRARRSAGQAEVDLEDLVRINCNRLLYIAQVSGLWL
ncbi:MAG: component of SufBCD complex, partial [Ascidiaceihabitans sp.]